MITRKFAVIYTCHDGLRKEFSLVYPKFSLKRVGRGALPNCDGPTIDHKELIGQLIGPTWSGFVSVTNSSGKIHSNR